MKYKNGHSFVFTRLRQHMMNQSQKTLKCGCHTQHCCICCSPLGCLLVQKFLVQETPPHLVRWRMHSLVKLSGADSQEAFVASGQPIRRSLIVFFAPPADFRWFYSILVDYALCLKSIVIFLSALCPCFQCNRGSGGAE